MRQRLLWIVVILAVILLSMGCSGPAGDGGSEQPSAPPPGASPLPGEKETQTFSSSEEGGAGLKRTETEAAVQEGSLLPADSEPEPVETDLSLVRLLITKDYGREILEDKEVILPENTSVLALLESAVEVTSGYGGGFVQGINGLLATGGGWGSGRQDWFYYVNGVFSPVGAADYFLNPGDVVWWDYHSWSTGPAFPALVGSYPEPFVNGFLGEGRGVLILRRPAKGDLAEGLKEALLAAGTGTVDSGELQEELLAARSSPTIVLGEWQELQQLKWLADLNQNHRRAGICVHFTDQGLELLDYQGKVVKEVQGSAGVIVATGEGSGDVNPLWLVVGTDREGLERAVEVLTKEPEEIFALFGAVIVEDEIIGLPLL